MRGDRHGEATVIPYDAAGASARACGSVEGSTLGAAEVRRTAPPPTRSGAVHMKLRTAPVHRSRAQLGAGVGQVACPSNGGWRSHVGCLPTSWPHLPISLIDTWYRGLRALRWQSGFCEEGRSSNASQFARDADADAAAGTTAAAGRAAAPASGRIEPARREGADLTRPTGRPRRRAHVALSKPSATPLRLPSRRLPCSLVAQAIDS